MAKAVLGLGPGDAKRGEPMTDLQARSSATARRTTIPKALAERIANPKAWSDEAATHALFAELRANHPLALAEPDWFDRFWVVTKHADILKVSRQNSQFLSGARPAILAQRSAMEAMAASAEPFHHSIVSMDAPEHPAFPR